MDMKLSREVKIGMALFYVIAIVAFILFAVVLWREGEYKSKTYHAVDKTSMISGVVKEAEKDIGLFNRGAVYYKLTNGINFRTDRYSRNFLYENSLMADFIQKSDSIFKDKNNDTIYIYRGGGKYYFVLDKYINEDKR